MAISATLSEYTLRDFDQFVSRLPNVFYYSRFVDDMVLITSGDVDADEFKNLVSERLPRGLLLNQQKCRYLSLSENRVSGGQVPSVVATFDFLGYQFEIWRRQKDGNRNLSSRMVNVDISPSKTKRIKTRVILKILQIWRTV
jgi:hypothetical protein